MKAPRVGDKVKFTGRTCLVVDTRLSGHWTLIQTEPNAHQWVLTKKLLPGDKP